MAVYAGDKQSLNASGPGGHCIDLIPLAALVTVDLMSLPTQRTDRVCLLPLPITVCMCEPIQILLWNPPRFQSTLEWCL